MIEACRQLEALGVSYETAIVSAHRTAERMVEYAQTAKHRGIQVIIAGAGGAAHLPGMTASLTSVPVIGVPVQTKALSGVDSLYSIVQMPGGIPVATVAINGAKNAALLAARILAVSQPSLYQALEDYREGLRQEVSHKDQNLQTQGPEHYLRNMA
jgi:5-(carboxyamino)imidazole ribonucleotide mutase